MGEKKSRSLLEKFDTIQKISGGSQQELSGVLGHNLAKGVHQFFLNKSSWSEISDVKELEIND